MPKNQSQFPSLKWTFSTLGCPDFTLEQCCQLAKKFDVGFVELRCLEGTAKLPEYFQSAFGSATAIKDLLASYEVGISSLDTSWKLYQGSDEAREELLAFAEWAEALDVPYMRVFDGGQPGDVMGDDHLKEMVANFEWWQDTRKARGWKCDIIVETHDLLVHKASIQRFLSATNHQPKCLWDTHHTWKKADEPVEDTWAIMKDQAVVAHVKDSITKPSARHPFTYVQLGEGEFPLPETLAMLENDKFDGFVCLEWERQWHPYLTELITAFETARSHNWL